MVLLFQCSSLKSYEKSVANSCTPINWATWAWKPLKTSEIDTDYPKIGNKKYINAVAFPFILFFQLEWFAL